MQFQMNFKKILVVALLFTLGVFLALRSSDSFRYSQSEGDSDSSFKSLLPVQKRSIAYATRGLKLADSTALTLYASEPNFTNPTNIDVDAYGNVWVCEGFNYRPSNNVGAKINEAGDRIIVLSDQNEDGIADKATTFYQGRDIDAALGILVLGNKVIASGSGEVMVLYDENNDLKADKKEVLFKIKGESQHDHSIHAFVYGPDGKLYFNFGNTVSELLDKNGNTLIDIHGFPINANGKPFRQGMVLRCNEDGTKVEVLGHIFRNNYEDAIDAFGALWQSDNDDDGNKAVRINYVMEYDNYGYQDEQTGAGWRSFRNNLEEKIPDRHWHQNDPGVVPNMLLTGAGSPTGILVYESDLLPRAYDYQILHCDAGPRVFRA